MRPILPAAILAIGLAAAGAAFLWLGLRGGDTGRLPPFLIADLDVDTDRNGIVDEADEEGEDSVTAARGAWFAVNYDADGGRRDVAGQLLPDTLSFSDRTGQPTGLDDRIENEADRDGIAPLVIRGLGAPLPEGVRVFLRAAEREDVESILVYARREPGARAIWGGLGSREGLDPIPTEIDITAYVDPASPDFAGTDGTGDLTFAVEGLFFRNDPTEARGGGHSPPVIINAFDGDIDLFLEIRRADGQVLSSDHVRMRVTPWLALPNSHESLAIFARHTEELDGENAPLIDPAEPGYAGLSETGQLVPVRGADVVVEDDPGTDFRWLQDHAVLGAYHLPGTGPEQRTHAALRLPYEVDEDVAQPAWVAEHLTGAQSGVFQFGSWLGNDHGADDRAGGGHGGNIGVIPPSATWPLGRIVVGDTMPGGLRIFLKSQRVQPLMTLPTQWLAVGHVDEMVNFTGRGGEAAIADPALAWRLMEAIPEDKRGAAVFFATGGPALAGTVQPSARSQEAARRLDTGIDHRGTAMRYIRIYRDSGSGAAGQVARIAKGGLGNGYVLIDQVWLTPTRVVPDAKDGYSVLHLMRLDDEEEEEEEGEEELEVQEETEWFTPPEPGDRFVMVRDTKFWNEGPPALITVEEVLADETLRKLNTQNIAARMASVRARLLREGGRNADGNSFLRITGVPVIFVGRPGKKFVSARSAAGFTPNPVNFQPAAGRLYLPRQFGPLDAEGRDIFETALREALGENVRFVDVWDAYHSQFGEVHCATNVLRRHFDFSWWAQPATASGLSRRRSGNRPSG